MVGALKRIYNRTPWQQRRLSQPLSDPNYAPAGPQHSTIFEEQEHQPSTTNTDTNNAQPGQPSHVQQPSQVSYQEPNHGRSNNASANTTGEGQPKPLRRGMTRADTKLSFRKSKKDSRRVFVNIPPPAQYRDSKGLPKLAFGSNQISTAKYTALSFLPKNLFEQFRRVANMFFLFMAIIQLTPIFTVGSPFLTVFPLCFVVGVTAVKDGFEDYKRHKEDRNFNQRLCQQLKHVVNYNYPTEDHIAAQRERGWVSRIWNGLTHGIGTGWKKSLRALKLAKKPSRDLHQLDINELPMEEDIQPGQAEQQQSTTPKVQPEFVKEQWANLRVGDFILLKNNQAVPADAIILSTSEAEGSCFIETKDLDGETNLKTRMSLHETSKYNTARRCSRLKCFVDMEPINANLFSFNGSLTMLARKRQPKQGGEGTGAHGRHASNRFSQYSPSITSSMMSSVRGSMEEDEQRQGEFGEGVVVEDHHQPAQSGTSASDYARLHKSPSKRRSRFTGSVDSTGQGSGGDHSAGYGDKQEYQEPNEMTYQDDQHPSARPAVPKRSSIYRTATATSMGRASEMARNVLKTNHEQQQQQHQQQASTDQQTPAPTGNNLHNTLSKNNSSAYKETTIPVDINNMLLRGHVIRNTYWVIAVIVATGTETKIMLNSGETPSKRSRIEKTMNIQVAINFLILILLCILCAVGSSIYDRKWRATAAEELWDMSTRGVVIEGVITFFTSLIIFQNIIPISLYISIEFVKTFQAYFIWQDTDMYDVELDQFCTPKTWNLTDDLGQIEYVFSDKTGTLTRNIMEFKKCTINGKIYGNNAVAGQTDGEKGMALMSQEQNQQEGPGGESGQGQQQQQANNNSDHQNEKEAILQEYDQEIRKLFEPTYMDPLELLTFADPELLRDLTGKTSESAGNNGEGSSNANQPTAAGGSVGQYKPHDGSPASNIHDFFTLLALCHTVVIEQPEEEVDDDEDDEFGMYDDSGSPKKGSNDELDEERGRFLDPNEQPHVGLREKLKQKVGGQGLTVPGVTSGSGNGTGNRSRKSSNAGSVSPLKGGHGSENGSGIQLDDHGKPKPTLCYRAESPDEAALVSAARNAGFAFVSRGAVAAGPANGGGGGGGSGGNSRQNVNLNIWGKDYTYEQLDVIKFNSTRKRMTVIVKEPAELGGKILLLTKGADNVIFERLTKDEQQSQEALRDSTEQDIETFSNMGLRTLTLAQRVLDQATYDAWAAKYAEAGKALDDRAKKVDQVAEEIETGLTLLGATAIEDKLQEGVPDAIASLREAGIKVWVLTGDKLETAINIGFASRLLEKEMKLEIMKMGRNEGAEQVLARFKTMVEDVISGRSHGTELGQQESGSNEKDSAKVLAPVPPAHVAGGQKDYKNTWDEKHLPKIPSDASLVDTQGQSSTGTVEQPPQQQQQPGQTTTMDPSAQHALIVDGSALKILLDDPQARKDLIRLSDVCFSVICCRASPLQKALVVELIRRGKKTVCLAIGDGANDVSMIQAANIGVGIAGQEGMQAAMASDYSITQFRFIKKLVLVHGHWGYMRIAEMILNFFFKNVLWVAAVLWFQIYCGFSAMLFYDYTFVSLYNLMLTAVPVLVLGATDQDLTAPYVLRYPGVYRLGIQQKRYNMLRFVGYMMDGLWQSLVVFWFWRGVFGVNALSTSGIDASLLEFSTAVAITNVIIASLYIGLHSYHWTWLMHFAVWGSIIFLMLLIFIYGAFKSSPIYHVAIQLFSQGPFWFMVILAVATAFLGRFTVLFVAFWWRPDDVHVVRGIMIKEKREAKAQGVEWTGLGPDGRDPLEQSEQELAILMKEDQKREAKEAEKEAKKAAKEGRVGGDATAAAAGAGGRGGVVMEQPYDLTMIQINVNDQPSDEITPSSGYQQQQQPSRTTTLTPLEAQAQLLAQADGGGGVLQPNDPAFQYNRRTSSYNYSTIPKNTPLPPVPSPSLPSLPTLSTRTSRGSLRAEDAAAATGGGVSGTGVLPPKIVTRPLNSGSSSSLSYQPPSPSPLSSELFPAAVGGKQEVEEEDLEGEEQQPQRQHHQQQQQQLSQHHEHAPSPNEDTDANVDDAELDKELEEESIEEKDERRGGSTLAQVPSLEQDQQRQPQPSASSAR